MDDFGVDRHMIDDELAAGRLGFFVDAKNATRAEEYLRSKGYAAASEPASPGRAWVRAFER